MEKVAIQACIEKYFGHNAYLFCKKMYRHTLFLRKIFSRIYTYIYKYTVQRKVLKSFEHNDVRNIEIGPGNSRIENFLGVNIVKTTSTDIIVDLEREVLPFTTNSIDIIYTSHFIEHILWINIDHVLSEFYRVLKPGGHCELWCPDGSKIAQTIIDTDSNGLHAVPDGWIMHNPDGHPMTWCNGRIFYGVNPAYPSLHKSLYTYTYLDFLLRKHHFHSVRPLHSRECRGIDHGWINLGVCAFK